LGETKMVGRVVTIGPSQRARKTAVLVKYPG
jgi:hypothetical protein